MPSSNTIKHLENGNIEMDCPQCQQKKEFRWALKIPGRSMFGTPIYYCVTCMHEIEEETLCPTSNL